MYLHLIVNVKVEVNKSVAPMNSEPGQTKATFHHFLKPSSYGGLVEAVAGVGGGAVCHSLHIL